jgi:O-acetyl-ADP-ribose deacetylase (regulator of RNase III)
MKINYVVGDATDPPPSERCQVIVHCCNNMGLWGRGFVVPLARRFPETREKYIEWARFYQEQGKTIPLGDVQFVALSRPGLYVANLIGQHGIHGSATNGPPIRYEAVRRGLMKVYEFIFRREGSVHMPRMGAGLAGGRWEDLETIVEDALRGVPVTVYDLPT